MVPIQKQKILTLPLDYEFELDENGNIVGSIWRYHDTGTVYGESSFSYNNNGNVIEWIDTQVGRIPAELKTTMKYDDDYELIEICHYSRDEIVYTNRKEYDEFGTVIEESYYDINNELKNKTNYQYDLAGYLEKSLMYDSDEILVAEATHEYDENGNSICSNYYSPSGIIRESYTFDYHKFDKFDNWTECITIIESYDETGSLLTFSEYEELREIVYYDNQKFRQNNNWLNRTAMGVTLAAHQPERQ